MTKMINDNEDGFGVVGAVAEFKVELSKFSNHYLQTVDKVEIYGLLVDHDSCHALAMKYHINFITDESIFYVCEQEFPCEEVLIGIIGRLDSMK